MKLSKVLLLPGTFLLASMGYSQTNNPSSVFFASELSLSKNDAVTISTFPTEFLSYKDYNSQSSEVIPIGNKLEWSKPISSPTWVNMKGVFMRSHMSFLAEPGDSVAVKYLGKKPVFSGKGAVKWELAYKIMHFHDSLVKTQERRELSSLYADLKSAQDFLWISNFMNKEQQVIKDLIESYKSKISASAYRKIKTQVFAVLELERINKFTFLKGGGGERAEKNRFGLTNEDLCAIFDTTMNSIAAKWLLSDSASSDALTYQGRMLKFLLYRNKGKFFLTHEKDSLLFGKDQQNMFVDQYKLAKNKFKGLTRERLMAYTFWGPSGIFSDIGFTPRMDSLLFDYYNTANYSDYKEEVKEYEIKYREKYDREYMTPFVMTDVKGQPYNSSMLNGKLVIMDFWFTGCKGCVQMAPALRNVIASFKHDSNVVFISVSVDKDINKWSKSIKEEVYTTGSGLHLYTNGSGEKHDFIQKNFINSYPTILIFDPSGKVVSYNKFKHDPRHNSGKELIDLINSELAFAKDGPYVFYKEEGMEEVKFVQGIPQTILKKDGSIRSVKATTDQNKEFEITLKASHSIEPSTYEQPSEIFLLSDIEGNFDVLRELLVNNKIIDQQFNWTFGTGHLVFTGDMFDRGKQVSECLWMMYMLEEKAKSAGGYVHFILGNHELMNLAGDTRYNVDKYTDNARKINKAPFELYSSASELGRWLRTKNVMEKIGNLLICHGGISQKINNLPMTIEEINSKTRPYFETPLGAIRDSLGIILMNVSSAPFWYRGYYEGANQGNYNQFDSTLAKFKVKHIVIGHTIVKDTISNLHKGRIFNIDTHHAGGNSEALYIKGPNYYRVNKEGTRTLFYKEDEN